MQKYNAYIDESGDEGINRGSKWFILTAVVVKQENDLKLSKRIDDIKTILELDIKSQLHWNSIKGFPNKKMIVDTLSKEKFMIVNIIINTYQLTSIPSKKVYNYYCGYLFERLTWFLKEDDKININISSRGNLNKKDLLDYLQNKTTIHKIDFSKINDIKIYANAQKKLLQMADCCCSALGQALKYNDSTHQSYITTLANRLYRKNKSANGYGIKIVPPNSLAKDLEWLLNL